MSRRSTSLKSLQNKWYKILKDEGFKDIECKDGSLNTYDSHRYRKNYYNDPSEKYEYTDLKFEARAEYYRLAEHFLNSYEFKDDLEKKIWEMHSKGISFRNIAKDINKAGYKADAINNRVSKLAKTMLELKKKELEDGTDDQ